MCVAEVMPKKYSILEKKTKKKKSTKSASTKKKKKSTKSSIKRQMDYGKDGRDCAVKYAIAISDPFNSAASGACIPRLPARESVKQEMRSIGNFETNGGTGFCVMSPSVTNNYRNVIYNHENYASAPTKIESTQAAKTANRIRWLTNTDGQNSSYLLPDSSASVPLRRARIIAAGLRIRYRGRTDDMNGTVYAVSSPSHGSLEDMSETDFGTSPYCKRVSVSKEWTQVTLSASDEEELAYPKADSHYTDQYLRHVLYPFGQGMASSSAVEDESHAPPIAGFWIECDEAINLKFEFEYVCHYEWYQLNHKTSFETKNSVFNGTDEISALLADARRVAENQSQANEKTIVGEFVGGLKKSANAEIRKVGEQAGKVLVQGGAMAAGMAMQYVIDRFSNRG